MPVQIEHFSAAEKSALLPPRHVFVYGTLRRGEIRDINLLRPAPSWVCEAVVEGMMYDLDAYPGLVLFAADLETARPDSNGTSRTLVVGEVYGISPDLEQMLDEIEEVWPQQTGEYAKREVAVRLLSSSAVAHPSAATDSAHSHQADGAIASLICLVYEIAPQRTLGKPLIDSGDWVAHRLSFRKKSSPVPLQQNG